MDCDMVDYKLKYERYKMLYENTLEIIRRYQRERENFIYRVRDALLGIEQGNSRRSFITQRCPLCGHKTD